MDNLSDGINEYISFIQTKYVEDTIPAATYRILMYDDMESARRLGTEQFQEVLTNVLAFAHSLYAYAKKVRASNRYGTFARHYMMSLIKELTMRNQDKSVIRVLSVVKKYDYDAWEFLLTLCSSNVRMAALTAERIIRFVKTVVYGSIVGAIISAILQVAVCMWHKI